MVIRKLREASLVAVCLALGIGAITPGRAQDAPNAPAEPSPATAKPIAPGKSAETLYLQLRSVGLDKSRVYRIRETSFDRAAFQYARRWHHAFTEDVAVRITGFFEGDVEKAPLVPPDKRNGLRWQCRRGYPRRKVSPHTSAFNDETFAELQPPLRPADTVRSLGRRDETARNPPNPTPSIAKRVSVNLPVAGQPSGTENKPTANDDRMLHARLRDVAWNLLIFITTRPQPNRSVSQLKQWREQAISMYGLHSP
jgi:hypothetical protein